MVVDGQSVIDRGIVSVHPEYQRKIEDEQIQPNGVDLRVESISRVYGRLSVPGHGKVSYKHIDVQDVPWREGWARLYPGAPYIVEFEEFISLEDGYCAIIEPRSSLIRSGVDIKSGVWDTGFEGRLGGVIRPRIEVDIDKGARLAQVVVFESHFNGHRYNGRYQGATSRTALMR